MDLNLKTKIDEEEELAIKLVKSASKELKAVEKLVAKKVKDAQNTLNAVEKEGEKEIDKSRLNLQAAFATKKAVKLRKRALGLVPIKTSEVGFLAKIWIL